MFQDGPLAAITPASERERVPRSGRAVLRRGYNTPRGELRAVGVSPAARTDAGRRGRVPGARGPGERPRGLSPRAIPLQQFHVLFRFLSKMLFIFRSLYLCAIGLGPIFSFRRNLPPILSCIPKQLDSSKELHMAGPPAATGFSPSATPCSNGLGPGRSRSILCKLQLDRVADFKFEPLPLHSPLLR